MLSTKFLLNLKVIPLASKFQLILTTKYAGFQITSMANIRRDGLLNSEEKMFGTVS